MPELLSASRWYLSTFAPAGLALGLTYCRAANLTKCSDQRDHLLILAGEALTAAEKCMALVPFETDANAREAAERLRTAITQLEKNSELKKSEVGTYSRSSLLAVR